MKEYKLKLRDLRASHTLGWSSTKLKKHLPPINLSWLDDGSRKTDKLQERSWQAKLEIRARLDANLRSFRGLPYRKRHVFIRLAGRPNSVCSSSLRRILLTFSLDSWVQASEVGPKLQLPTCHRSSFKSVPDVVFYKILHLWNLSLPFSLGPMGFYQRQWVFILYPNYIMIRWEDDD
jgi:hypothetical protein